ncbi:MAG: hypothetical protein EWV91_01250 [Microcystis aeruginosa Ma_QC_Ca_00000000_S207]|uniref:Uncharacterized protein n=1 Tax=Microcystis aeruginosa Ma_QC_Ca_00000000_S207 TaxID=2486251 RepID=A0A552G441_MICAE|nr:MAG: hypothetical protein EWV91_01250 [Microcystis aeruginosa Ma_QC_Ca_00000000_S207]
MWRQFLKSFKTPRGLSQGLFVLIGSLGLFYLLVFCPKDWVKANDRQESILRGIASSLLLVGGLDLLSAFFQAASDKPDRDRFERFFGTGISNGVVAIFPSAKPTEDPSNPSFNSMSFPNMPEDAKGKKAKGAEYLVVSQDLDAALELADTFRSFGEEFKTELDYLHLNKDLDKSKECIIALGLGFNHVTGKIRDYHRETKLFEIIFPEDTDDFRICKEDHPPIISGGKDYALLVRGVKNSGKENLPHFVCAGRTAHGTKAAGIFLATQWKELLSLYEKNRYDLKTHSVAVFLEFNKGEENKAKIHGQYYFVNPSTRIRTNS